MVDAKVMLHPKILELFGGNAYPECYGLTDVKFPSMLKACQWLQVWSEESGTEPDVSLTSHGPTLLRKVIVTVRGG